jgi:transposase
MCRKWFARFRAGNFDLDDAPRSGRPVEVDDDQIKTLIENNPRNTTRVIAEILKMS